MKTIAMTILALFLYGHSWAAHHNAEDIVIYTLLGEARCQLKEHGQEPMLAIGQVILNRARERQMPVEAICLQRRQFSCWNDKEALFRRSEALMAESDEATVLAQSIAAFICNNMDVHGTTANHYYQPDLCSPQWAEGVEGVKIGDHLFLEL